MQPTATSNAAPTFAAAASASDEAAQINYNNERPEASEASGNGARKVRELQAAMSDFLEAIAALNPADEDLRQAVAAVYSAAAIAMRRN